MTRPLRLEFHGALYHVTARGDRREPIYADETDRGQWLAVLEEVCQRYNWVVHAYCQMTNHYHLVVETPDANLSKGMRQLNGLYTQRFNRRHRLVGHLFQGRYKAILVQKDAYLLAVSRYVVLNPVRAGIVRNPLDWPWSSLAVLFGHREATPKWLDTEWVLSAFGRDRKSATEAYWQFIQEGMGIGSPLEQVKHQLLLGDDQFVERFQALSAGDNSLREVSKAHRRSVARPLGDYQAAYRNRNEAMARAFLSGAYTMQEIGDFFGVHYRTVSRAVRAFESTEHNMSECQN